MKIELNQEDIESAIKGAVAKGIESGVSEWKIRDAIASEATRAVEDANLPALVGIAMDRVLSTEVETIVEEAVKTIAPALRVGIHDAALSLAVDLAVAMRKNRTDFMTSDQERRMRDEIRKDLAGRIGGAS